jgi:serine/threonine protein kinase
MAPEMLRTKKYGPKIDVYSFGIILWEMVCARTHSLRVMEEYSTRVLTGTWWHRVTGHWQEGTLRVWSPIHTSAIGIQSCVRECATQAANQLLAFDHQSDSTMVCTEVDCVVVSISPLSVVLCCVDHQLGHGIKTATDVRGDLPDAQRH